MQTWPSGSLFGLTKRHARWLLMLAGLAVPSVYAGVRIFDMYKADRISRCVSALAQVHIGDSAQKAFSLTQGPCGLKPGWRVFDVDLERGVTQLEIENWGNWKLPRLPLTYVPFRPRHALGLRYFQLRAVIRVDQGSVRDIWAAITVEGGDGLLTAGWYEPDAALAKLYVRKGTGQQGLFFFDPLSDDGREIRAALTPDAPEGVRKAVRRLEVSCLASLRGCPSVGDLMPDALPYIPRFPMRPR